MRLLAFFLFALSLVAQESITLVVPVLNDATTGTVRWQLAKPTTSNPTAAVRTSAGDTNAFGICVSGCGTSGYANIALVGKTNCDFDGATTAGNFVQISGSIAGKCTDAGSTRPSSGKIVGRVITTNTVAGLYEVILFAIGTQGSTWTSGGTISASWLPNPAVGTKGGAEAKTCSGNDKLSAIGVDGVPVCTTDVGGSAAWGGITGTLSSQTDLQTALDGRVLTTVPGTGGTAPNYASGVLNIPLASVASVTAGLISKAQYDIFNGKQDALGFTAENSANKNATGGYAGLSGGLLAAAQLPLPSTTTLGGVKSLTCGGTNKVSSIGTDGVPVCTADQNTDAVSSVFGRTGAVVATANDYSFSQLSGSIASGQQNNPAAGAKGGVEALTCSGTNKLSAIGTDGIPVCSADQSGAGGWTTLIKTADQLVTNSATLADDTVLQFATTANTQYTFRLRVYWNTSSASADFKYRLTHTGTTTRVRRKITRSAAAAAPANVAISTAFDAADVALTASGAGDSVVFEDVIVQVGASGGVIKFQFAQNTQTASQSVTVYEGSYLEWGTS